MCQDLKLLKILTAGNYLFIVYKTSPVNFKMAIIGDANTIYDTPKSFAQEIEGVGSLWQFNIVFLANAYYLMAFDITASNAFKLKKFNPNEAFPGFTQIDAAPESRAIVGIYGTKFDISPTFQELSDNVAVFSYIDTIYKIGSIEITNDGKYLIKEINTIMICQRLWEIFLSNMIILIM